MQFHSFLNPALDVGDFQIKMLRVCFPFRNIRLQSVHSYSSTSLCTKLLGVPSYLLETEDVLCGVGKRLGWADGGLCKSGD
jgi:hypothetical protein